MLKLNPKPAATPNENPSVSVALASNQNEPTLKEREMLLSHTMKEVEGAQTEAIAETPPPSELNPAESSTLPISRSANLAFSVCHAPDISIKSTEPADISPFCGEYEGDDEEKVTAFS